MKKQTEENLQARIVKSFTNKYCLKHHKPRYVIFSCPNGGTRNSFEASRLKASGVLSGVSDLIVLLENKTLFIELKNGSKGSQSKNQKDFEIRVTELGFNYYLVRSLEGFKKVIDEHTNKP